MKYIKSFGVKSIVNCPIFGHAFREYLRPKYLFLSHHKGRNTPPTPGTIFENSLYKRFVVGATNELDVNNRDAILPFILGAEQGTKKYLVSDYEDIRNLLVTGSQGGGKSRFIMSLVMSMKYFATPSLVNIHVLDYKGNLRLLSPLCFFERSQDVILKKLEGLKKRRVKVQAELDKHNFPDLKTLNFSRKKEGKKPMPYNLIIIDEYASLVADKSEISPIVEHIASMGRSAGFFLLISTQRADHITVSPRIKSNFLSSISFAQRDAVNSNLAGVKGANHITKAGQFIYNHKLSSHPVFCPFFSIGQADIFVENIKKWLAV